jgi:choloylglycine hydrolase
MSIFKISTILLVFVCTLSVFSLNTTQACSVFKVTAKDGTMISARTMEFGFDLKSSVVIVPRNTDFVCPAPDNSAGLKWKSKYGYVAVDAFEDTSGAVEGINEAGLAFSALWYEKNTKWQDVGPSEYSRSLGHLMLGSWILGNFSDVQQVKDGVKKIKVYGMSIPEMGDVPLHFAIYDAKGKAIVIECDDGVISIYDNPLGLMTNSPKFPWMMTNLRNYLGLFNEQPAMQDYASLKLNLTGHGAGMLGLPGDITPPSRFVRMTVMTHFADQQDDAKGLLNLAQHIVYSLDIVKGMVIDRDASGKVIASETTQWASFRDLTNKVFYFRTYDNFTLRKIDLAKIDFNADKIKTIPLTAGTETIVDVTDMAK